MRRSGVRISSRAPKSVAIARVSSNSTPVQDLGGPLTGHKLVHFRTARSVAGTRCELRPTGRLRGPRWVTQPARPLRRGHLRAAQLPVHRDVNRSRGSPKGWLGMAKIVVYSMAYRGDVFPCVPIASGLARTRRVAPTAAPRCRALQAAAAAIRLASARCQLSRTATPSTRGSVGPGDGRSR